MSDNDRMERAERIRQMREGQRDEDDDADATDTAEESETADETGPDEAADRDGDADPGSDGATSAVEDVSGTSASLPSTEEMEAAMERTMEQAEAVDSEPADGTETDATGATDETESAPAGVTPDEGAGPAGVAEEATTTRDAETRVLEFTLGDEQYCLDIEYIEEIVKEETITRVPNTPAFVEGVVDLRGQITTILNPKVTLEKADQSPGGLIVVFDSEAFDDQGAIGWVVDDVRQVSPVTDDQVNDPPMGEDYINGVIDRGDDEEFVIWTTPDLALDEAE